MPAWKPVLALSTSAAKSFALCGLEALSENAFELDEGKFRIGRQLREFFVCNHRDSLANVQPLTL
jgi:hypothetical protein